MNPRIYAIIQRVQAEQDEAARAELMAQTNDELGQHFIRPNGDYEELAFDLFNLAFADASNGSADSLVSQIIEEKTVGLGDTDWIEEDLRGMRVYFQGKGGQIRGDIQRYERTQMPREELVGAIDMHQDEVATDFWGSLPKLQSQLQTKLRIAPAEELVALIQSSIISGTTYGSFAAATIADTQVDPILDIVASKSYGELSLVGTNLAIRKFANIGLDFGQQIQGRIFESGVIATYKGYPVVQLGQWEDFDGGMALPDDEIWIIGRRSGRYTKYGNQAKVQTLRLPSFYLRTEFAQDSGMALYGAAKLRVGRIVLT